MVRKTSRKVRMRVQIWHNYLFAYKFSFHPTITPENAFEAYACTYVR